MDNNERNDNVFDDRPTGELTFGRIFKIIKYSALRILVYALVAVIIAGIASVALTLVEKPVESISAVIEFNYDGISEGKDPIGTSFNSDIMKKPIVLNRALDNTNLRSDSVNASNLQSYISITGVIPPETLAKIEDLKKDTNTSVDTNEQIANLKYYSTRFVLSLNNYGSLDLSEKDATVLMKEIIKEFQAYWEETYNKTPILSTFVYKDIVENGASKEFAHYSDILSNELSILKDYLSSKVDIPYVYSKTGDTYASLLSQLTTFEDTVFRSYDAFIYSNNVYQNKTDIINELNHNIMELDAKINAASALISSLNEQLKNYEQNTTILPDGNGGQTIITSYPEQYSKIQETITKKLEEKSDLESKKKIAEQRKEKIENTQDSPSAEADVKRATELLVQSASEFLRISENAQNLTDEYRENVSLANSVKQVTPVSASIEKGIGMKTYLIIFAVAIVLAALIAIAVTLRLQKKFSLPKRNNETVAATVTATEIDNDSESKKE